MTGTTRPQRAPSRGSYRRHSTARARERARRRRRRRTLLALLCLIALGVALAIVLPRLETAVHHFLLPLRDAEIIREQAAAKHLDPAMIAAVIYAESKFSPRTSPAGAEGLMQLEPSTARFLAHLSGGYDFTTQDLATPRVNVAYGSYYLRYLLNHYHGDEMLAIAAYNAGLSNVDSWSAQARRRGRPLTVGEIPFPETRDYVKRVFKAQREYRQTYPDELGTG